MNEFVGQVTKKEKERCIIIYERILAYKSLLKTLKSTQNDEISLSEVDEDIKKAQEEYENWWNEMSSKYYWILKEGKMFQLDFETGNVYYV